MRIMFSFFHHCPFLNQISLNTSWIEHDLVCPQSCKGLTQRDKSSYFASRSTSTPSSAVDTDIRDLTPATLLQDAVWKGVPFLSLGPLANKACTLMSTQICGTHARKLYESLRQRRRPLLVRGGRGASRH